MQGSGSAKSYWMDSTEATSFAHLADDVEVDVAVIGGGIAGLCTAWELARTGASVALVGADRIAAGVTGYTTAKLTAQHGLIYAHLRSKFDEQAARWYATSQLDAIAHVVATVADLGIDCDLERRPAYTYLPEEKRDRIEAEVDAATQAGLTASLVTETGLPYRIGAAIRVEHQAQFHPRRYLLALAADLVHGGGRIFERTRIVELDEGEPCRITSEAGVTVTARDVVVATHYPSSTGPDCSPGSSRSAISHSPPVAAASEGR
jgi:glycine/D-amino acid oxidase-like deaminating enzyme